MEPEKAHSTDEFVIVAKFGGHVLRHLASRLANVIDQGGSEGEREGGRVKSFYNCCTVLCTTSGFINVEAV